MTSRPRNSMAAVLTLLMTGAIWLSVVFGIFAFVFLGIGLVASLNDGALQVPGAQAISEVSALDFAFVLVGLAIVLPGVVYVCLQLRRILSTLAEGDPFVPENAGRLSMIAIALAVMEVASMLLVISMRLFAAPGETVARPALSINLVVWAAVAALLVLSQVFREGTRLREEEKMTI
ncbi:MAG: DUF2975 domain-containing protein [Alphaproteobacteria bacterium]|nr:DUF2975 domain-containing protein [Alphaproteobacteria bacterium]